jgi:predicted DNA-binding transcriptional regulator AlpA
MSEIQQMLGGVSRQRASEIVNRASFPKPVDVLATGRIWERAAVERWIREHRPTQRDD